MQICSQSFHISDVMVKPCDCSSIHANETIVAFLFCHLMWIGFSRNNRPQASIWNCVRKIAFHYCLPVIKINKRGFLLTGKCFGWISPRFILHTHTHTYMQAESHESTVLRTNLGTKGTCFSEFVCSNECWSQAETLISSGDRILVGIVYTNRRGTSFKKYRHFDDTKQHNRYGNRC